MKTRNRKSSGLVLLVLLIVAAFAWGFLSCKGHTFPYNLITSITQEKSDEYIPSVDVSQLKSLPYVTGSSIVEGEEDGVTKYIEDKAYDGYNLFSPFRTGKTFLIDMHGNTVHEWKTPDSASFLLVRLEKNGDLTGLEVDKGLVKLNKDSNVLWRYDAKTHHDLDVDRKGRVYVLTHKEELLDRYNTVTPVLNDYITVLTDDGKFLEEWPVIDIIENSPFRNLLPVINYIKREKPIDILHTNSIEIFDGSLAGISPLFREGNMLISCREINLVFIYNPTSKKIVWGWGANSIYHQHHPSLLSSGDVLVFDNGFYKSKVLELDPIANKVKWVYGDNKNTYFYSRTMGSAQRLPNGNTLIADAEKGVVFEVTPDKKSVWRYVVPYKYLDEKGNKMRSILYRMERIRKSDLTFLK